MSKWHDFEQFEYNLTAYLGLKGVNFSWLLPCLSRGDPGLEWLFSIWWPLSSWCRWWPKLRETRSGQKPYVYLFAKRSLICLQSKSMIPNRRKINRFPLSNFFVYLSLWPLKDFLGRHESLQGPSDSPCSFLSELQWCKDTLRHTALDVQVQGRQEQQTKTFVFL